jgi:hypothetical protein
MQTWHHVLEKSEPKINNINALHGPFRRLLFNSGLATPLWTARMKSASLQSPMPVSLSAVMFGE